MWDGQATHGQEPKPRNLAMVRDGQGEDPFRDIHSHVDGPEGLEMTGGWSSCPRKGRKTHFHGRFCRGSLSPNRLECDTLDFDT